MLHFNDIRKGKVIVLDDEPYVVASAEFLRKQQRRPVMRTILKHLRTNTTREHSFQQSDRVAEADIERKACQFLYNDGTNFVFMDDGTYEQFEVSPEITGGAANYLLEGQMVELVLFEGKPVAVDLPIKIDRKVIEAAPGVRGDTSSNVMKEVTIEGGGKVRAPLFINEGDVIRIDTRTNTYVERAS